MPGKWQYVTRKVGMPFDEDGPMERLDLAYELFVDAGLGVTVMSQIIQWVPCVIMDVYGEDPEDVALFASCMMDRVVHVSTVVPNPSGEIHP